MIDFVQPACLGGGEGRKGTLLYPYLKMFLLREYFYHYVYRLFIHFNLFNQVEDITRDNLNKVIDRGEHLDDLQQRAG